MSRRRAVVVVLLSWLPLLVLAALGRVFVGWRVPALLVLVVAILVFRSKHPAGEPGTLRSVLEFVVFAALGGVVGGLALGGVAAIIGVAFGFMLRLGEIPVTKGRSFPLRRAKRD
ncbi:MAG TPA: hypothetical protein VJ375_12275 [Gaiellaceae bacterium]|nr:hypothetical protein [Gaiellaceae bacterium]